MRAGPPRVAAPFLGSLDLAGRAPFRPAPEAGRRARCVAAGGGACGALRARGRGLCDARSGSPRGGAPEGRGLGRGVVSALGAASNCRGGGPCRRRGAAQGAGPERSLTRP